ncbi:MAG: adenylate/guanylate cyclase domain-containing protein, partial [Candidatus Binatia bacterium]
MSADVAAATVDAMMLCSRCGRENRTGRKFCADCGSPLALVCNSCGARNRAGERFCGECGHSLAVPAAPPRASERDPRSFTPKHLAERILTSRSALEGERKQVTVLFADMKGSMEFLADRDPEEAGKILDRVLAHMAEAVHRYEGTVNQVSGDGIMALFGAPLAHEDHALRAAYAALRMQESMRGYAEETRRSHGAEVQIRVGLHSGEVVVQSIGNDLRMDYTAVGETVHLAARMEQLATPGTIRLTADTARLVEAYIQLKSLGPIPVKGLSHPVEAYEASGTGPPRTRFEAAMTRGLAPFVGRAVELGQLERALDQTKAGHGRITAVLGEAGIGKSRLLYELTHSPRARGVLILDAGCVSYGKATSYLPVIDLLKEYFQIREGDDHAAIRAKAAAKLTALDPSLESTLVPLLALLDVPVEGKWQELDPPRRRQQTLDAVKRLLLRESRVQPLLLVFEDLHWVDAETQVLLGTLVDSLETARLLLLLSY